MAYYNGKITAPVEDSDIKTAVSNASSRLDILIRQGDINMWGKYKPVVWGNRDTTAAFNSGRTGWNTSTAVANQWWRGTNGDYGLSYAGASVSIPYPATSGASQMISALTSLLAKVDGSRNGWTYIRPSGGASSPYRWLDFLWYRKDAPNPIQSYNVDDVRASSSSGYTVFANIRRSGMKDISDRDYIMPEDLTSATLHIGIAIFKKNGSNYEPIAWVTGGSAWQGTGIMSSTATDGIQNASTMDNDQYVTTKLKDGQTYYVLPFFATVALEQPVPNRSLAPTASQPITLITAPYTSLTSFKAIQGSGQRVGLPELTNHAITNLWTYSTTLKLDSTVDGYIGGTATDVKLAVVNELYDGTFATGNYAGTGWYEFGNVTVASSEVKTVGRVPSSGVLTLDSSHTWRVIVSVSGTVTPFSLRTPIQPAV